MPAHPPDDPTARGAGADPQAPMQLYALRLRPAAPQTGRPGKPDADGLHGDVEHVLSGARCTFRGTAELLAWLEGCQAAAARPAARMPPDQGSDPAARDATM